MVAKETLPPALRSRTSENCRFYINLKTGFILIHLIRHSHIKAPSDGVLSPKVLYCDLLPAPNILPLNSSSGIINIPFK